MYLVTGTITDLSAAENLEQAKENVENLDPGVIQEFLEGLVPEILAFALQVILAVVVYLIGRKLIRFLKKLLRKTLEKGGVEEGVMTFLVSLANITMTFILVLTIGTMFGITTASVVAVIGSAGLTAGFALQGSLANFAGGVLILLLKPFRVGDYIIEDTNKNEGKVDEITIFYTRLLTVDNKVVVVPNGTLANSSLTNVTHQDERLVQIKVGISYNADIKAAKKVLQQVLEAETERIETEDIKVFVDELADSAVIMGCRIWVNVDAYWDAKWRLNENIKLALDAANIEIPFQQLDVTIRK